MAHKRDLPWRHPDGLNMSAYYVWISEIMLQQTVVAAVRKYFLKFINLWPTVYDLAEAPLDDVLHAWQGLGYYSRARNLHRTAKIVAQNFDGQFPSQESELLSLPGIGPYTAAAIQSIAYNLSATVVDGNVERVISRVFQIETPLPEGKKDIHKIAASLRSEKEPSNYAQALMDLGATICTPKSPKCPLCPLKELCKAKNSIPEDYPRRAPKKAKPIRHGTFYWIENEKGEVFLEKRKDAGLLGGMVGFPSIGWDGTDDNPVERLGLINIMKAQVRVTHVFTHFNLVGEIIICKTRKQLGGIWATPQTFHRYALPTLMKKVPEALLQEKVE